MGSTSFDHVVDVLAAVPPYALFCVSKLNLLKKRCLGQWGSVAAEI